MLSLWFFTKMNLPRQHGPLLLTAPLFLFWSPFLQIGGGGRVGHDAGTNPWPFAGGGSPTQPGHSGGHLSHHAHRSAEAGRLPPAGNHAVPATLSGEAGEEAARHQDGGEEEEESGKNPPAPLRNGFFLASEGFFGKSFQKNQTFFNKMIVNQFFLRL